jgi:molybdate-binding protein
VAAVAGGHADCAIAGVHVARAAGLDALPTGRSRVALVLAATSGRRDPGLAALLEALASAELRAAFEAEGYRAPAERGAA